MQALKALAARFKEPSSWAGLGLAMGMLGLHADPGLLQGLEMVGAGICTILSVVIPEGK